MAIDEPAMDPSEPDRAVAGPDGQTGRPDSPRPDEAPADAGDTAGIAGHDDGGAAPPRGGPPGIPPSVPVLTVFPPPEFAGGDAEEGRAPGATRSAAHRGRGTSDVSADEASFAGLEPAPGSAYDSDVEDELTDQAVFDASGDDDDPRPVVFAPDGGGDSADDPAAVIAGPTAGGAADGDSASESALFNAVIDESTAFEGVSIASAGPEGYGASDSFSGDSQGIAEVATPSAPFVATAAGYARSRRTDEGGGVRQMAGIVLGGVLAIPVAYCILLWGFQRDPLRFAATLPEGARAWLPARVRGVAGPRRGPSLDRLPTAPPTPSDRAGGAFAEAMRSGTDGSETVSTAPGGGLDGDVARVAAATRALGAGPLDGADRDARLMDWYREVAAAAARMAANANAADAAPGAVDDPGRGLADVLAGQAGGAAIVDLLRETGATWLGGHPRDSDGAVVVGTLVASVQRGGLWSSEIDVSVAPGDPSAPPVSRLVVVSRRPPAVAPGSTVIVAGALLADGVVWAAAVWSPSS